jgi:hypothetical protein
VASVLLWAGLSAGGAGLALWQGLVLAATLRDPDRAAIFSFRPSRAMQFQRRTARAAGELGRRNGVGRVANVMLAVAVTLLMAAGVVKVVGLIVARQAVPA